VLAREEASRRCRDLLEYERIVVAASACRLSPSEPSPAQKPPPSDSPPCSSDQRVTRRLSGDGRFKIHLLLPWAWELVHHPVLVRAARECLGTDDVWCWSTDVNAKEPLASAQPGGAAATLPYCAWHQDAAFAKMDPPSGALTAWVALTPSDIESGCLYCVPGSHRSGDVPHAVGIGGEANVLAHRQEVQTRSEQLPLPDARTVNLRLEGGAEQPAPGAAQPMALEAGQASLHGFLTVHASPPNRSRDRRRVGLAIRYVSAHCRRKPGCSARERATLVSGDGRGLFEPEAGPRVALGEDERRAHAASLELERRNYLPDGQSYR
jgi:chlorinating enzyme